jgi:hypothetical protein
MANRKTTPKQNGPQIQEIHQTCTASGGPVGGSVIAGLFVLAVLNLYKGQIQDRLSPRVTFSDMQLGAKMQQKSSQVSVDFPAAISDIYRGLGKVESHL